MIILNMGVTGSEAVPVLCVTGVAYQNVSSFQTRSDLQVELTRSSTARALRHIMSACMRKCRPVFLQLFFCVIPHCMIMGCVSLGFLVQTIPLYCLLAHISTMYLIMSKISIHRCKVAINAPAVLPSGYRIPCMPPSKNRICPAREAWTYRCGGISSLVLRSARKYVHRAY